MQAPGSRHSTRAPLLCAPPPSPSPPPQSWVGQERNWESESLCLDCHNFSWRAYRDPGFMTPAEVEKKRWEDNARAARGVAVA